ncbi:hypothetical protein RU97_GL001174 [Enterococcus canis]|uniref:N-acetyltransferase domain-containing protein n=1 Tax=Enterococcus canis TaxID=214095 RepID=A0A1L8RIN8_9ENTE|nr:GNAT family N-acetyltransferase [Enterococcus canis]OJG19603.1 hypothetical protein RU97_GL001174 [Enterococcus canis]
MEIRKAEEKDITTLNRLDVHVTETKLDELVLLEQVYVVTEGEKIVGWLRYNFFWDEIPFMNMLFFDEAYRGKGYGTRLVCRWEEDMKMKGYKEVMTSTVAEETAQHFYYSLGYHSIGGFTLSGTEYELILCKQFRKS